MAEGAWVLDVRSTRDFAREHIPGTINIPAASKSFLTYAGTVLTYDRPILIIAKTQAQASDALAELRKIGFDHATGIATVEVLQQMKATGKPLRSVPTIEPAALADRLAANGTRVLDVRGRSEWNHGHLAQAVHIYLGDVVESTDRMSRDAPIVVHCQSGSRSSIAASLLMARGFSNITNFAGGVDAWRKAGLPLVEEKT